MSQTTLIYRHRRRGTTYRVVGRGVLRASRAISEGTILFALTDETTGGISVWPEAEVTSDAGRRAIATGELQSDHALSAGTEIVVYADTVDGRIWFRPASEFDDGRFIVIKG